jgi:hypothetical protein
MIARGPRFPNKLVVIGVSFLLGGAILLLWTAGFLDRFVSLWPVLPTVGGLVLLYFRVFREGRDSYIFFGTSLILTGVLLLLASTAVPVELSAIWPLFLLAIGVSLLLYGYRKIGTIRVTFIMPGIAMVLLSLLFLPFSTGLVAAEFSDVVRVWWPVLLMLAGGALILAHLSSRGRRETDEAPDIDE